MSHGYLFLQRVNSKELPHFTGYLRKGLRTVSSQLSMGGELRGFSLKVSHTSLGWLL